MGTVRAMRAAMESWPVADSMLICSSSRTEVTLDECSGCHAMYGGKDKNRPVQHPDDPCVHNRFIRVGYSNFPVHECPESALVNAVISAAAAACVLGSLALGGTGLSGPVAWAFALGVGRATWWAYTWQRHVKSTRPDGLRPDHLAWHRHHWSRIRRVALLLLPLASAPLLLTVHGLRASPRPGSGGPTALLATSPRLITVLYAGLPGERGIRQSFAAFPASK